MEILIVALSVLSIFLSFFMFRRDNKLICFSLDNLIIIAFIIIIYFGFPFCYIGAISGITNDNWNKYIEAYTAFEVFVYYIIANIVEFAFVKTLRIGRKSILSINDNIKFEENNYIKNDYILLVAFCLFVFSFICEFLYLRAYGSYSNYLNYSKALRSGYNLVDNPFSFLSPFRKCFLLSTYLFLVKIRNRGKFSIVSFLMYLLSFFFSMRVLISNAGILAIILFFIVQLVYVLYSKVKALQFKTFLISTVIGSCFLFLVVFASKITNQQISKNVFNTLSSELSFIFANFNAEFSEVNSGSFRFFIDVLIWPVYFLPSSLWKSFNIITASDVNTKIIMGAFKGVDGVTGEIPVDMITMSYMQLGIVGIIVVPIVLAFFYKLLFKYCDKFQNRNVSRLLKIYLILDMMMSIIYSDPIHFITGIYLFFVFMVINFTVNLLVPKKSKNCYCKRSIIHE